MGNKEGEADNTKIYGKIGVKVLANFFKKLGNLCFYGYDVCRRILRNLIT